MWPFSRKGIVDADTARWLLDNMTWLEGEFGEVAGYPRRTLVLPRPGFFQNGGETGHALALRIFADVKDYCGMSDWPVELVADDDPHAAPAARSLVSVVPQRYAAGRFVVEDDRVQITYATAQLRQPEQLVATFSHELAHYLHAAAKTPPPCEADEYEFLTDLTSVFLGFGVFAANARFQFEQFQDGLTQGWQSSRSGYLPETDLVHALALYLRLAGAEAEPAASCLKPHLGPLLHRALRTLPPAGADVARLRAGTPAAGG